MILVGGSNPMAMEVVDVSRFVLSQNTFLLKQPVLFKVITGSGLAIVMKAIYSGLAKEMMESRSCSSIRYK